MSAGIQAHADVIEQFRSGMREHGLIIDGEIIADGRIHRYRAEGDRPGSRNVWAKLHLDGRPSGAFGSWRSGVSATWSADRAAKPMTREERRAYREEMNRKRRERQTEQRARHAAAAALAKQIWDAAEESTSHPYLERKQIQSHGLRVGKWEKISRDTGEVRTITKQALLIPIRDNKKRIHSLQAIFPGKLMGDRDKDYLTDGAKEGYCYTIGKPQMVDGRPVIIICEGYATGASLLEATGHAVIVAFDAPNLLPVARMVRDRYPDAMIVMAADNDQWTFKPVKNPGLYRACEAAEAVGALVAFPPFAANLGKGGPTDFNDLHVREGLEAVRSVIEAVLRRNVTVVLAPSNESLLGAAYALRALRPDAQFQNADGGAISRDMSDFVFEEYGDDLALRAARLRERYSKAQIYVLARAGEEQAARDVSARCDGVAEILEEQDGGPFATWFEYFMSMVDAEADADPVAREFSERAIAQASADPTSPIAMGVSGNLFGFWRREGKVELVRASDVFKDAGILRLQDLAYWQAYCTAAGVNTAGGKYDRTMVGNALMQKSKLVGALDARNVPASVASPDMVRRELNLALMHAKPNAYAVAQVLLAHPDWQGIVWMNMFAERAEARVDPPCGGGAGPWTDRHDMLLGAWLSAQYGVSVSKWMVGAAVGLLAHADQRHPVRDYLNSLAWDGTPRLDTWLTTFAGCEDDTYTRNIGAKTMIGAVARIMEPGVKFDTTLVLEGDQGLRKSTLICALAPKEEWYTDALDGDLGSKDAAIGLAGKWLIEVPEMATLGRTRVEVIKSFLTRRVDHFRAPHAVRAEDHPRQCAFFGTINPEADGRYLSDTTGGRRFWPVRVRRTNVEALEAIRAQLWAEAVACYKAGEQWWLTDEVEMLAKQEQADRQESNPWTEHVERFMEYLPPDEHNREWGGLRASVVKEVSTGEIFAAITGRLITRKDTPDARAISAALKVSGWVQKSDKSRRWVHE